LLVTRLDGPTPEIARGLVDKAVQAERDGLWGRAYFDLRLTQDPNYKLGDEWIFNAATVARLAGYEVYADTNEATFAPSFPMSQVALYAGWYNEHASGPFTLTNCEFMPGAFAYHLHSFSAATIRTTTEHWVGPLLARGATCTMGSVAEPYLQFMPDMGTFMGRFLIYGFTFAESAYAATPTLSWQTTVIGDPLYRPGGKNPQQQHLQLAAQKNPLLEWSHLKVINLNLVKRFPVADCVSYLEENHVTQTSAVLSEKLGEIQAALGKPASAIRAWQAALTLNPSPMQRLRLRLTLGEKFTEQGRVADAIENYRALLTESPNYLGNETVRGKITALEASAATVK
jgi:tetratricopeptide (TPR) repeat protein